MLSTTVHISGRPLYFYTTRNKFVVQPPSEYTSCHLECSQWTNPSRDFFGSFRELWSAAFCATPSPAQVLEESGDHVNLTNSVATANIVHVSIFLYTHQLTDKFTTEYEKTVACYCNQNTIEMSVLSQLTNLDLDPIGPFQCHSVFAETSFFC